MTSFYQDFEDVSNFTCEKLFELNKENIETVKENTKAKDLNDLESHLIALCKFSKITESNDFRTVFERHFQYIRNGILSIDDFSYEGLIKNINEEGTISRITLFFNSMVLNTLELTITIPHRNAINENEEIYYTLKKI